MQAQNTEKRIDKMKTFLVDYAHLISQLKPSDKILVVDKGNYSNDFVSLRSPESLKFNRLSAEIQMKDVTAFQQGKISREEVLSRIEVNKNDKPKETYKDLELLKTMFNRLYSSDLSETYYRNGNVEYERIGKMGAVFYLRTVSSTKFEGGWSVPTQDKQNLGQEERDQLIKGLYPQFEEQLKENIVEYGRTINTLGEEEQLIFNVKITKCSGCDIPKNIELTIPIKDLKAYNSGKLTKEQAMNKVSVNKGEMQ